jgi:hypothetical protein
MVGGFLLYQRLFLCTPSTVVFPAREQPGIKKGLLLGKPWSVAVSFHGDSI